MIICLVVILQINQNNYEVDSGAESWWNMCVNFSKCITEIRNIYNTMTHYAWVISLLIYQWILLRHWIITNYNLNHAKISRNSLNAYETYHCIITNLETLCLILCFLGRSEINMIRFSNQCKNIWHINNKLINVCHHVISHFLLCPNQIYLSKKLWFKS